MKRTLKVLLITFLAALTLTGAALAAGYGLGVFADVRTMDSNTFRDVDSLAWYFGGVCRAYDKGIMDGTGAKTFSPKTNVTWSQAITIAARIHSRYNGYTLDTACRGQSWYSAVCDLRRRRGTAALQLPQGRRREHHGHRPQLHRVPAEQDHRRGRSAFHIRPHGSRYQHGGSGIPPGCGAYVRCRRAHRDDQL
jgi:hypothetical protein